MDRRTPHIPPSDLGRPPITCCCVVSGDPLNLSEHQTLCCRIETLITSRGGTYVAFMKALWTLRRLFPQALRLWREQPPSGGCGGWSIHSWIWSWGFLSHPPAVSFVRRQTSLAAGPRVRHVTYSHSSSWEKWHKDCVACCEVRPGTWEFCPQLQEIVGGGGKQK